MEIDRNQKETYFLPADYHARKKNITTSDTRTEPYWSLLRRSTARYWQRAVYQLAEKHLMDGTARSVLDVGCGYAIKLAQILAPHASYAVGVDYGEVVEMNSKAFRNIHFENADFEQPITSLQEFPPALQKRFDVIICADVIEHIHNPDLLLQKIKLWAHAQSRIFISTPERDRLYGKSVQEPRNPEHVREWNASEFKNYLSSRGFTVENIHIVPAMSFNLSRSYLAQLRSNNRGRYNMVAECSLKL